MASPPGAGVPERRSTGKQRWIRIEHEYYKQPNRLDAAKLRAAGIALVLSLLVGGVIVAGALTGQPQLGAEFASRGSLANPHATWEKKCDACHQPFAPMSGEAGGWAAHVPFLGSPHAAVTKCNDCHKGDGSAAHHASEKADEVETCAACHVDHRGLDASLVRMDDVHCTRCHANLDQHHNGTEKSLFAASVKHFSKESHPEFKAVQAKDPGKLKFNHALHMRPGLGLSEAKARDPFTLADIKDPAQRARYLQDMTRRGIKAEETSAVELDCSTCHVLDNADFGLASVASIPSGVLKPRGSGATMEPITYEIQCAACHRLEFDPDHDGLQVPHRVQPSELRPYLQAKYAELAKAALIAGAEKPAEGAEAGEAVAEDSGSELRRLFPGKPLERVVEDVEQAQAEVDKKVAAAEAFLFTTHKVKEADALLLKGKRNCGECHEYTGTFPDLQVVAPNVNALWMPHATFDHSAHRAVNCKQCHAKAYPGEIGASDKATDVLLPGIETCVKCHAPSGSHAGEPVGGARFDCAECHRYHNGDQLGPTQGLGARHRNAALERDVIHFLNGTK